MKDLTKRSIAFCLSLFLMTLPALAYSEAEFAKDDQFSWDIYRTGDVQGALAQARKVYDKTVTEFGPEAQNTLHAGITLSNMMLGVKDSGAALALLETLHARATKNFTEYAPIRIKVSVAYANLLGDTGSADKALPLHIEAVTAAEALFGPDHDTTLIFSFNLARTYQALGYVAQSLALYERLATAYEAVKSVENLNQRSNITAQIAATYYDLEKFPESVAAFRKAIPMLVDYWGRNHPRVLSQQLFFGNALLKVRGYAEVKALLGDMRAAATVTYGPDSLFHADTYELEALLYTWVEPGRAGLDKALALMAQSIAVKEQQLSRSHPVLGRPLLEYAAMAGDAGNYAAAAEFALRAETAGFASRDILIKYLVRAAEANQMPYETAAAELFRVVQKASSSAAGFATLQLATRFALNDSEDANSFRQITDSYNFQKSLEAQLFDAISKPQAERDTAQEGVLRRQIADNAVLRSGAETALYRTRTSLADLTGGGVLTVPEVQTILGTEGALVIVDFGDHEESPAFAMAVTEAGLSFAILPYGASDYAAAVADIRAGISLKLGLRGAIALDQPKAPATAQFDFKAADWLYDASIGQVFAINGKRKHLYADLRGPMAAIPPHLLITKPTDESVTDQTASWLVRDFAITVLPSVFSLKLASLAKNTLRHGAPLLGFANPVYTETGETLAGLGGQTLRGTLSPLPETETELSQVAAAVKAGPEAQRVGPLASEAGLKQTALGDYDILYFATHGLVSGDVVGTAVLGEPALALTGGQGEDGLLTASEISQLKLNADWVVLSACNTAVGDEPGGQALSGLARAFTYAGARSLLVSHWPVESQSAVRMMTDIFKRRDANPELQAAQAQREAILSMIDTPKNAAWSHPAYWAPFVLVGDPD